MASNTVQRNAIVAPFQVNTPLIDKDQFNSKGRPASSAVTRSHVVWLQSVEAGINATVQITATIPAHANSPGQPGTIAFGPNVMYLCVGQNQWTKFTGAAF